jgi:hypothetical protein
MAFLFQDQNQGTRNVGAHAKASREAPQPFSFIRTLTVGFGFAPNLLTLPPFREEGARGLGRRRPYRRWGLSPRPENIGRSGMERPDWNYKARFSAGKRLKHAETACPHAQESNLGGARAGEIGLANSLTNCKRDDSDSGLFRN